MSMMKIRNIWKEKERNKWRVEEYNSTNGNKSSQNYSFKTLNDLLFFYHIKKIITLIIINLSITTIITWT